jgi:cation transport ATPase
VRPGPTTPSIHFFPSIFPEAGAFSGPSVYFTETGLIIGFIMLCKTMEHIVKGRASDAIRKLIDLQPRLAKVLRDWVERSFTAKARIEVTIIGERNRIPPWGLLGGGPGQPSQYLVRSHRLPQ